MMWVMYCVFWLSGCHAGLWRAKVGSVSGPCCVTLRGLDEADDQRGSAPVPVLQATCRLYLHCILFCVWLQTQPQKSRLCFIVCSYIYMFVCTYMLLGANTRATGGASRVYTVLAYAAGEGHDSAKPVSTPVLQLDVVSCRDQCIHSLVEPPTMTPVWLAPASSSVFGALYVMA